MKTIENLITRQTALLESLKKTFFPSINISVDPKELLDAIAICKKAVPDRPTHPVLANFLLSAQNGIIKISSTDLSTFIDVELDGEIIQEGSVCLSALILEKIVKTMQNKKGKKVAKYFIDIQQMDDDLVSITHKSCKQTLRFMSSDEFPATPEVIGITHSIPNFVDIFKRMITHCSKDYSKYTLRGINIGNKRMVASDGHTIAIKPIESDIEAIIPATTPMPFKDPKFIVEGDITDFAFIKFFENRVTVTQRMIAGENFAKKDFPIPTAVVGSFYKQELLDQLEIFDICCLSDYDKKPSKFPIWMEFTNGDILVSAYTKNLENTYKLELGSSYDNRLVYLDSNKLKRLLKSAGEVVEICVENEKGLIATRQDDLILGVMPLNQMDQERVAAKGYGYCPAVAIPYERLNDSLVVRQNHSGFKTAETLFSPYHIADDGTKTVVVDHSGFHQAELTDGVPYNRTKEGLVVNKNRGDFLMAIDIPYEFNDGIIVTMDYKIAGFATAYPIPAYLLPNLPPDEAS